MLSEIIKRAQTGRRDDFEPIVRQTARLIWSHLMLKCRSTHRAEDLTQETYLRAWRAIGKLSDPNKLRAWLISIADSVFLDDQRKRSAIKRIAKHEPVETINDPADHRPTPSESSEVEDEKSKLLDALERLPEHYRQALSLKYLAGLDYDAITTQLALTNGALRGILHRGLEILRIEMKGNEK